MALTVNNPKHRLINESKPHTNTHTQAIIEHEVLLDSHSAQLANATKTMTEETEQLRQLATYLNEKHQFAIASMQAYMHTYMHACMHTYIHTYISA